VQKKYRSWIANKMKKNTYRIFVLLIYIKPDRLNHLVQ